MSSVPDWFETAWWKCGMNLESVWPVTRGPNWKHRYTVREYWTYLTVLDGSIHVTQGAWRGALSEADQVILPPGHPFDIATRSQPATFLVLDFRILGTLWSEDPLPKIGLPAVVKAADLPAWRQRCRALATMFGKGDMAKAFAHHARPLADSLISEYLVQGFSADAFADAHRELVPDWLVNIRTYMHNNYQDPDLSFGRLVRETGYSPTHVHRLFTRTFGLAPMAYVAKWRLGVARRLLDCDPFESITRIGLRCGFRSPAYFTRAFTRAFGTSPSKWRQRSRKDRNAGAAAKIDAAHVVSEETPTP